MKPINCLVIGSGGREHAICLALSRSSRCGRLIAAPGNPGMEGLAEVCPVPWQDAAAVVDLCKKRAVDLVVVGPEAPLAAGLADELRQAGLSVFGPGAAGAQLESDKAFAKDFMRAAGVPTARSVLCRSTAEAEAALSQFVPPYVVKATGLAAGKGVFVEPELSGALSACRQLLQDRTLGAAGEQVLIEEGLTGRELSVMIVTDGKSWRLLPFSQDHKRLQDGDKGPNTGGMGAYAPVSWVGDDLKKRIIAQVVEPSVAGLVAQNIPFRGVLYAGLMIGPDGKINVLEYNVRLGDPEAQVLLPLCGDTWLDLCLAAAQGELGPSGSVPVSGSAVCVVLASKTYPFGPSDPAVITGVDEAEKLPGVRVFHSGTSRRDGKLLAVGGRVLCVSAAAATFDEARELAYRASELISFDGCQKRNDIGHDALKGA